MPILIIEHLGQRDAGTLNGRVLIGRWPDNTIVIDDRAVSRIHAWIGRQDGRYYIADAGSRTGTFVNGEVVLERHILRDGDQIRIGPASLKYRTDPVPPTDAREIDLTPRSAEELSGGQGKFIDCVCGAPLWVPNNFTGSGQCRYCGNAVVRSKRAAKIPPPAAMSPAPIPRLASKLSASGVRPAITMPEPPPKPIAPDEPADSRLNGASDDAAAVEIEPFSDAIPTDASDDVPLDATPAVPANSPAVSEESIAAYWESPAVEPSEIQSESEPAPLIEESPAPWDVHSTETAESLDEIHDEPPAEPHDAPASEPPTDASPAAAPSTPSPRDPNLVCGVCHAPITIFDETTPCPSCGLIFHCDCWHENRGCSAYGCPQVGALDEKETLA